MSFSQSLTYTTSQLKTHLGRDDDVDLRIRGPVGLSENIDVQVKGLAAVFSSSSSGDGSLLLCELAVVGLHHVVGQGHILEHRLELLRKGGAALLLELEQHRLLGVGAGRAVEQEALGKVALVELLKHVLCVRVAKEDEGLVEHVLELVVGHGLVAAAQADVEELGWDRNNVSCSHILSRERELTHQ